MTSERLILLIVNQRDNEFVLLNTFVQSNALSRQIFIFTLNIFCHFIFFRPIYHFCTSTSVHTRKVNIAQKQNF